MARELRIFHARNIMVLEIRDRVSCNFSLGDEGEGG